MGITIDGATYTLDNAGNRTAKTDQRTAVATSYGYDNIYQLLSATQGATTAESYTYDPVGRRPGTDGTFPDIVQGCLVWTSGDRTSGDRRDVSPTDQLKG